MRHSSDFYKVVNAVINTINTWGGAVPFRKSDGSTGEYTFNDDNDAVREELMAYNTADDDKDLCPAFAQQYYAHDVWTLFKGNDFIHLAIDDAQYCDMGSLAELIADEQELTTAEVTQGTNGYPRGLYDVVLLNDSKLSFEQMEKLAEKYGIQVVSLKQKAGWQFWENEGTAFDLYDYADFIEQHDDNIVTFDSFKAYADYLRETARDLQDGNIVAEMASRAQLDALADEVTDKELGDNEFVWVNTYDITRYETDSRKVSSFSYDSRYYTLALDCSIV